MVNRMPCDAHTTIHHVIFVTGSITRFASTFGQSQKASRLKLSWIFHLCVVHQGIRNISFIEESFGWPGTAFCHKMTRHIRTVLCPNLKLVQKLSLNILGWLSFTHKNTKELQHLEWLLPGNCPIYYSTLVCIIHRCKFWAQLYSQYRHGWSRPRGHVLKVIYFMLMPMILVLVNTLMFGQYFREFSAL